MSLPQIKQLNLLNNEQLTQEILASKKELFKLRLKQSTKQYFTPHSFRHIKHRLGQLMMLQKQRRITNTLTRRRG
jgi:large subunit ribosomal protein L29